MFSIGVKARPWIIPAPAPAIALSNVGCLGIERGPRIMFSREISSSFSSSGVASGCPKSPSISPSGSRASGWSSFESLGSWWWRLKNGSFARYSEMRECEENRRKPSVVLTSRGGRRVAARMIGCVGQLYPKLRSTFAQLLRYLHLLWRGKCCEQTTARDSDPHSQPVVVAQPKCQLQVS